jgi:hypothetical protein
MSRVTRCQRRRLLQSFVGHQRGDDRAAMTLPPVRSQYEDIGEVSKRGLVGDRARERDEFAVHVAPVADRVPQGAMQGVERNARGPVGLAGKEVVDPRKILAGQRVLQVGADLHDVASRHQPSLSRNFSASSAAMQPKPAEVMAWR